MPTTIQVSEALKKRLLKHKGSPRETYEEVIAKALDVFEEDEAVLSPAFKKKVTRGRKEIRDGKGLTTDELLKDLGL